MPSVLAASSTSELASSYGQLPLSFEPNVGQTQSQVQFVSHGSNYALFLMSDLALLELRQPAAATSSTDSTDLHPDEAVVQMQLVGGNLAAPATGLDPLPGKSNYLTSGDPADWHTNVSNFGRVEYQDVYPGINLIYHGDQQQLEYDFDVSAGANPSEIKLNFQGADQLSIDAQGNLVIQAGGQNIVEHAPIIYQDTGGARQSVAGGYVLESPTQVGFHLGPYDPGRDLVIDPVLVYSTYFGGSQNDFGNAIAVDKLGNAYVTGTTFSTNLVPSVLANVPLQGQFNGFGNDAFVAKFDAAGNLVYATYLGGNPDESQMHVDSSGSTVGVQFAFNFGNAIAVWTNAQGQTFAVVTGETEQAPAQLGDLANLGFPQVNPLPNVSANADAADGFVAELDPTGSNLVFSSYLPNAAGNAATGANVNEDPSGIAVEPSGNNVYVTGTTISNFPTTVGPPPTPTDNKAFVLDIGMQSGQPKIAYDDVLQGNNNVEAGGVAVDSNGNAYVGGSTSSSDFATGTFTQETTLGGWDGFVTKVDPTGAPIYAVRLGGSGDDFVNAIAVDAGGDAYVTGETKSSNFPVTLEAFQTHLADGARIPPGGLVGFFNDPATSGDAFVAKINPAGNDLLYSTYLGGSDEDSGNGIAVDGQGDAYVVGTTTSLDFPTVNAVQPNFGGGRQDAFVAKLDSSGSRLIYSTYLGGSGQVDAAGNARDIPDEGGHGIALDPLGSAVVTGFTGSKDFPVTKGAYQSTFAGGVTDLNQDEFAADAFVTKIADGLTVVGKAINAIKNFPFIGQVATFTAPELNATPADFAQSTIVWGDGSSSAASSIQQLSPGHWAVIGSHTYTTLGAFPVVVTVHDDLSNTSATTNVDVSQLPGNQSETNIAVDPSNPQRLFAVSNNSDSGNGLFAAYSTDGGVTWAPSDPSDHAIADGDDQLPKALGDPKTAFDQFGNLFLVYTDSTASTVNLAVSSDGGKTFSLLHQFVSSSGVVDQPSIATGPGPNGVGGSVWLTAAFIDSTTGKIANTIAAGAPVTGPITPQSGGTGFANIGQFSIKTLLQGVSGNTNDVQGNFGGIDIGPSGQVLVSYEERTSSQFPGTIAVNLLPGGDPTKDFNLAVSVASTQVGFSYPIPASADNPIDAKPRVAYDRSGGAHNGRVYLTYTDVAASGGPFTDIFLRFSDDDGQTWSPPVKVNDDTAGHYHFWPSVAVDQKTGDVAVSWYDTRNDTGTADPSDPDASGGEANDDVQEFAAVSSDGGVSFSANVQISIGTSNDDHTAPLAGFRNIDYGDYEGLAFNNGILYPVWADNSTALGNNPDLPNYDVAAARVAVARVVAAPPNVTGSPVTTSEGGTFSGTVATFTDDDPTLTVDDFTASIQWGDGGASSTTDGSVSITSDGNGGFIVRSSHEYQEEGAFPVVVTVHDIANNLDGSTVRNVSQEDGNQAEGTVAVDPTNPSDVFIASVDENGATANPNGGGLFAAYSTDGDKTWNGRTMADGSDGLPLANGDPKAVFDQFGNLFLTYLSADGNSVVLARSSDGGQSFTLVQTFSPGGIVSGSLGVDQPSIATGAGPSAGTGSVWLSFTDMQDHMVDVTGALVSGKGSIGSFSSLATVPGSNGGAFGSIAIGPAGQVLVSYLNPNAAMQPSTIFGSLDAGGLGGTFGPAVSVTTTNVGTQDFIAPQAKRGIEAEAFLTWDNSNGPHRGRVYLVYVDSQANGNNDTDIFVRDSGDNGAHWSAPVRVNDASSAASRFLPNIAVDPATGAVAVAWYDTRNDPAGVKAELFAAVSNDGGQTFTPNVQISSGSSDATDPKLNEFGQGFQFGDYIGLTIAGGVLYPVWADNSAELGLNPDLPQFDLAAAAVVLAQVADLPLTGKSLDFDANEGEVITDPIASFTDADPAGTVSDYSATINWGDGSTSTTADGSLTISAATNGGFEVTTNHAFKEEGKFTYTLTISDGGTSTTVSDDVDVDDNDLQASGRNIRPVEGQQFAGVVATFTDGDPQGNPTDYTNQIGWPDGSQSQGTVVYGGSASLTVDPTTNQAYAIGNDGGEPSMFSLDVNTGKFTSLFSLGDTFTGGLALDTQTSQLYAIANDAGGFSTLDVLGTAQTPGIPQFALGSGFTGGLAFDSSDGSFFAIANDASGHSQLEHIILPTASSPAQISSVFSLGTGFTGGLTFDSADGMLYAIASDANGSSSFYRIDPVAQKVTNLFSLKSGFSGGLAFDPHDGNFYAIRGSATGDATFFGFPISGFTPSQESDLTSDFTDGFDVLASHTFADESTQNVTVAIADLGGSQITALGSATVVDFAPQAAGKPPKLFAFQGITTGPENLASFTVPGGLETGSGEYTASIDWGDGQPPEPGTLTIASSTLSDTATVTANEVDTNQANNTATATTVAPGTPKGPVDLAVTNVSSSAIGTVGVSVTYTITVKNNSPSTNASGVVLSNVLPAGTTFVSAADTLGGAFTQAGSTLTDTIGALAQGASDTITLEVTPTAVGAITDTATVEGNESDPSQSNNTATVTTPVEGTASATIDLAVTNVSAPAVGTVGVNLTYTITVENNSSSTGATGVVLVDALPANALFVSATDANGGKITHSGSTLTGGLAQGASDTITVVVRPTAVGAISNTATVEGNESDASQSDNTATVTTPVEGKLPGTVDLSVTITGAPVSVPLGQPETYTITVQNATLGKATGVVLTDALPADATFVSAVDAGGGTITHSGNTLTETIGTMEAGAADTVTVVIRPTAVGTISDKAFVEGDESDADQTDNTAALNTVVADNGATLVDLALSNSESQTTVAPGTSETYTITVTNESTTNNATGVVMTDALPANAAFVSATDAKGGTITRSGNTLTDAIGALAPNAADTITIVVQPTADTIIVSGSHTYLAGGTFHPSVTLNDDTGNSAVATAAVNVAPNVSTEVHVNELGGPQNPSQQLFHDAGTLTSLTNVDVPGPIFLVVKGLPPGVTLANANGKTGAGDPFITDNITKLLHEQTVASPTLIFDDPQKVPFDYTVTPFDGPSGDPVSQAANDSGASAKVLTTLPLSFEPNQGQTDKAVQFLSQGNGYSLFLTANQALLALNQGSGSGGNVVAVQLIGANPSPQVVGADPLPGTDNDLIGNDPSHWQTNVPTYGAVEYQNIYPGVTLDYHGTGQQLEYDFIVAANADPGIIRLGIQGATGVALDAQGNLVLQTSGGDVVEQAPVIYQEFDGQRRAVAGGYVLLPNQQNGSATSSSFTNYQVGFQIGPYDHTQPLVIDPVLKYSTYLGGSAVDLGNAIAVDAVGNVYVVGTTKSPDFPTVNPLQGTFNTLIQQLGTGVAGAADARDAFVTKLDPTGQVVYSTFFGGSEVLGFGAATNSASGVAVDGAGNVYFTGSTDATDFPTVNAFQSTLTPLATAAFVAKLDPTGSTLLYSTYLGSSASGPGGIQATGIAVDANGEAYVTGFAAPGGIPTVNALQPANLSQKTEGGTNAFISKLNSAGSGLIYSTYLGGSVSDTATAIAVDASGNAYVTGETQSSDFPTTAGAFQSHFPSATAFASTNTGSSWSDTGLTVPTVLIVPDPVNASTLYAAASPAAVGDVTAPEQGLLKSTDGGATWSFINGPGASDVSQSLQFKDISALAIDPTNTSILYAGANQEGLVFKSTDGGQTWSKSSSGLVIGASLTALAIDPSTPTTIYAATTSGVFKSTDGANTWTASPDSGLVVPPGQANAGQATSVTSLLIDPTNPATLYGDNGFGVYESTDGGGTWTFSANGLPNPPTLTALALAPSAPTTLYAGTQAGGIFKSTDGGSTWASVSTGLPSQTLSGGTAFGNVRALAVDPTNPNTVYGSIDNLSSAHAGGGVFKSTDGGSTWQAIDTGLPGSFVTALAVDPVAPSTIYAGRSEVDAAAFVAKVKPDGSALIYSTFLGGTRWNLGAGIAVDAAGNAYITGSTASTDFPTVNPLQPANHAAVPGEIDVAPQIDFAPGEFPTHTINPESTNTNAFLAKLSPDGSTMVYGTYLGGSGNDSANAIAVDAIGNAYVVGGTSSTDFPTANALQPQNAGGEDAFVARVNAAGTALDYSTYLGGSGDDSASGVAVDAQGNAYVVGTTLSNDLRTVNAQQPVQDGNANAFIAMIAPQGPGVLQLSNVPIQATEGAAFSGPVAAFSDTDSDTVKSFSATIDWGDGQSSAGTISAAASGGFVVTGAHTYSDEGTFPVFVTVSDADGTSATAQSTAVNNLQGGAADYHITVDTSALSGTSGFLDFQFNPGALPDAQSATVSISDFSTADGTLSGSPTITGGASGALSGTLQLTNASMLNEATFPLMFGSQLSFDVQISGDAVAHPNAGVFGSTFSLLLLGADGVTPEATTDAGGSIMDIGVFPDGQTSVQSFAPSAGVAPIAVPAAANMVVVADATLTAVTAAIHPVEGIPFTGTVATFTDANPASSVADYTATIDWGDGSPTTPGTVTSIAPGQFSVSGTHTYATEGTNTLKITIADRGGSTTVAAPAKVSRLEAPLRETLGDFLATTGLMATGHLTGSGNLDLVLGGNLSNTSGTRSPGVDVLLGNGDGTFQTPVFLPTPAGITSVAIADLTGNGKQDIVVTDSDGVSILLGNGDGTFQPPTNFSTGGLVASDVAVGDFAGNGKLDLAVANFLNSPNGTASNLVSILLGNGDGTFQPPTMLQTDSGPDLIVAGDFTGNGKIDLATLNAVGHDVSVLLGNGDGTFQPAVNYPVAGTGNLVAADLTGNGKLDLVTLGSVLINRGDGAFLPAQSFPTEPGATSLVVGDFSGDGRPGLAIANALSGGGSSLSVYLGKGDGTFQPPLNLPEVPYGALLAGDFDNDGKLDLAAIPQSSGLGASAVDVLLGNGDGTFPSIPTYSTGPNPQSVLVGNFHGDKVQDLVTVADGELTLARGRGDGTFVAGTNYPAQTPEAIAAGDFTNNGRTDLVTANLNADSISLFLANADGTYQAPRTVAVAGNPNAIAVGDFDGDGKLDVAVATQNGVSVLLGNGDGTFQPAKTFAAGQFPEAIAVGDFRGDGKLDLAVADADGHVSVLLGNGDGSFQPAETFAVGDVDTRAIAVGDLDGDGKLDLVTANYGAGTGSPGVSILFANGDGTFQPAVNIPVVSNPGAASLFGPEGLTLGDFDGDGKLDLALTVGKGVVMLLNKGNGNFQAGATIPIPGSLSPLGVTIATGDAKGDGKLDLFVVSGAASGLVSVLLGNGDGTFQPPVNYLVGQTSAGPTGIVVGNLTGDGHLDFATANFLDNTISVVKGNGDGTFQAAEYIASGPEFAAEGDFTGSGKLDLVTSSDVINNQVVKVFLGNGDGTFQPPETLTVSPNISSLGAPVVGDFTGNGKLDIAVPGDINAQDIVAVFLGNGDGTFQQPIITTVELPVALGPDGTPIVSAGSFGLADLAVGDFDRDGKLDLVGLVPPVPSSDPFPQPENVVFFAGNGDGTFKQPVEFSTGIQSTFFGVIGIGDFRGDGKLDVAVISTNAAIVGTSPPPGTAPAVLSVLLGNGDGTFQPAATTPLGQFVIGNPGRTGLAFPLTVADLKNNGKLDLITANSQTGDVSVLFGNGDGTFAAPVFFPAGVRPSAAAVGDFDGDGSPDLAVADAGAGDVAILLGSATPVVTSVTDASLTAQGASIAATVGASITGVVATFTESSGTDPAADFSATIAWGDGTTSSGTITPTSSGNFQVSGTKTYAAAGTFSLIVTIQDKGGAHAEAGSTAAVAPPVKTSTAIVASSKTSTYGDEVTYTATVSSTQSGTPTGTVTFLDGTTTLGAELLALANGLDQATFTTSSLAAGAHTITAVYAGQGGFLGSPSTGAPLTVNPAPLTIAADSKIMVAGGSLPPLTATYTGLVNGDTPASLQTPPVLSTTATSASPPGTYPISVSGAGDPNYSINFVAGVLTVESASSSGGTITATAVAVTGYERSPLAGVAVATFTDGDGSLPVSTFAASIDWGDGTTSAGAVTESGATYTVAASHTYTDEGHYTFQATLTAAEGGTAATVTGTATIHEQLLATGAVGTPDQKFIQEIYRDLLFRQAEAQGLNFWVGLLESGENRPQVAEQMSQLAFPREFQRDTVRQLYKQYLNRAPDAGGDLYWTSFLFQGGTIEAMSQALVNSPEYWNLQGGTIDGFLNGLYLDALGRQVDPGAKTYFEHQYAGGMTVAQIAATIFASDEYHRVRIDSLFEQFLDRPADAGALTFFANGFTDEQIIVTLLSSDEYYDKSQI